MTLKKRLLIATVALPLAALLFGGVVFFFSYGRLSQLPPVPQPNGYDDLLAAGSLAPRITNEVRKLDQTNLSSLLATNQQTLKLLRLGLSRTCAVPTAASVTNFDSTTTDLMSLKRLAVLLDAEGRLAELAGHPEKAAQSLLDAVRLGNSMSHGGFIIHRLVGIACEGIGTISFLKLLPQLNCEQLRPLASNFEMVDAQAVPWSEVVRKENCFVRSQLGKHPNPIKLAEDLWQARDTKVSAESNHNLASARLRLLATELALRAFRCETGAPPASLQDLVPKHLQRVPIDPFSGHPLAYRTAGTNWLLYSFGPDRIDNQGRPLERSPSREIPFGFGSSEVKEAPAQGDLLFDSPW